MKILLTILLLTLLATSTIFAKDHIPRCRMRGKMDIQAVLHDRISKGVHSYYDMVNLVNSINESPYVECADLRVLENVYIVRTYHEDLTLTHYNKLIETIRIYKKKPF